MCWVTNDLPISKGLKQILFYQMNNKVTLTIKDLTIYTNNKIPKSLIIRI